MFLYVCIVILLVLGLRPWSPPATVIFLALYNIIFIFLLWSMVQTIRTDPGRVPLQWVRTARFRGSD